MPILNSNWAIRAGQYGLKVIEVEGRCTPDNAANIERDCTHRYVLEPIPNASGAVLKSLDGTNPKVVNVKPSTTNTSYQCVKVEGIVNPFAPSQDGDHPQSGDPILRFHMRYQQVGAAQ